MLTVSDWREANLTPGRGVLYSASGRCFLGLSTHLLRIHALDLNPHLFCFRSIGNTIQVVKRLELCRFLEEDVSLDEPGEPGARLVCSVTPGRHAKDIIEFFEGALPMKKERSRALAAVGFYFYFIPPFSEAIFNREELTSSPGGRRR